MKVKVQKVVVRAEMVSGLETGTLSRRQDEELVQHRCSGNKTRLRWFRHVQRRTVKEAEDGSAGRR